MLGVLLILLGSFLFLAVYFSPIIIARYRRVRHFGSIFVINLFLGVTFVGWVIALAMACSDLIEEVSKSKNECDKDNKKACDEGDYEQLSC